MNQSKVMKKIKSLNTIHDYTVRDLKEICGSFFLKKSGRKQDIYDRIEIWLEKTRACVKIQSLFRGYMLRKLFSLQQLHLFHKSVNDEEFYSLDEIDKIPLTNRICVQDDKDFVYCFDIYSLKKLFERETLTVQNPYNTKLLDKKWIKTIQNIEKLSTILKRPPKYPEHIIPYQKMSYDEKFNFDVHECFSEIDSFGYITNTNWIFELHRIQYIRFILYFFDIWNYRADLSLQTKRSMYPPSGNPFHYVYTECQRNLNQLHTKSITFLKTHTIYIMKELLKANVSRDHKGLSALYILSTITLVHPEAATAFPMLFESVRLQ